MRCIFIPLDKLARDFLTRLNALLKRRVTVVLIGGNALMFLGFKTEPTKDVDIVYRLSEPEVGAFSKEYLSRHKVKSECFFDGLFKHIRIKDYLQKAYPVEQTEFPYIDLRILNIYDVVLTKIDRSADRDLDDILKVINAGAISAKELDARFQYLFKYTVAAHKEHFREQYEAFKKNFGHLLKP